MKILCKIGSLRSYFDRKNSFLFQFNKARQKFEDASNRIFTYEDFSYNVVRLFFDQLHHATSNEVTLADALELMIFCNHEGQIEQKSDFETRLYNELCEKITDTIHDRKHICLIWMYLRSWGPSVKDKTDAEKLCGIFYAKEIFSL